MGKKDLEAAAAGTLKGMKQTPAQKMIQQAVQEQKPATVTQKKKAEDEPKNTAPFTIWAPPETVKKWKAYLAAKKLSGKTQNEIIRAAIENYMQAYPVTDEERAELIKALGL